MSKPIIVTSYTRMNTKNETMFESRSRLRRHKMWSFNNISMHINKLTNNNLRPLDRLRTRNYMLTRILTETELNAIWLKLSELHPAIYSNTYCTHIVDIITLEDFVTETAEYTIIELAEYSGWTSLYILKVLRLVTDK